MLFSFGTYTSVSPFCFNICICVCELEELLLIWLYSVYTVYLVTLAGVAKLVVAWGSWGFPGGMPRAGVCVGLDSNEALCAEDIWIADIEVNAN